jgi:kynureninase
MRARIYKRPKTATQSGPAAGVWVLDYAADQRERNDPLMGWWGGTATQGQVRLRFESQETAVAYAESNGIAYDVEVEPAGKAIKPKIYADNFRYGRVENWTH